MKRLLLTGIWILLAVAGFSQQRNPLAIPDTLSGFNFSLTLAEDSTQFLNGAKTRTLGINQGYLAPTLILRRGDFVQMHVTNALADTTTLHWHGMHVAPTDDGGPHTTIAPGTTWSPDFTIMDEASTYWYHPHLHEHTAEQVYYGAAGMIIVHDSLERSLGLPHTYGVDDFPLIIQDKSFDSLSNQLIYEAISDTMMINGTLNPYLNVPAQMVRFRILNASNQRVYNLGFPQGVSFMIASDGGLLEQPLPITRILLAPGERTEVIVDFTGMANNLPLISFNSEMGQGISGGPTGPHGGPGNPLDGSDVQICDFRVVAPTPNPVTTLASQFRTYQIPNPQNAAHTRIKDLTAAVSGFPYYISGFIYDMDVINDTVRLGDIEVWEIHNNTDVAHPLHIHDVQFHVIDFNGGQVPGHLRGRKDVILTQPGDTIRFVTRFEDFSDDHTPYMFHCHNLFHEDGGMMGQFLVVDTILSGHQDAFGDGFGAQMHVFPNPTKGLLYLEDLNIDPERVTAVEVIDVQGHVLAKHVIDASRSLHTIDLGNYCEGIYLLRMQHKGGGQTFRRIDKQ